MFANFGASFQESLKNLQDFIDSLPEEEGWKDFISTASGETILELIASLASFLQFEAQYARLEVYPNTAKLRTSLINLASAFGYSVNRNSAMELQVTFISNYSGIWSRLVSVGEVEGKPLSLKEDTLLEKEKTYSLNLLVGDWRKIEFDTSSEEFQRFDIEDNVDNNYFCVYFQGEEIETTKYLEELDEKNCFVQTTPFGIAIMFGDGYLGKRLRNSQKGLRVDYLVPVEVQPTLNVDLDIGTVESVTLVRSYQREDSLLKISTLISGYYSSKRIMTNLDTHRNIAKSYEGLVDAYAYINDDDPCCTIRIVYLREDKSLMNDFEKNCFLDYLFDRALIGVKYEVEDPTPISQLVKITVYIGKDTDTFEIQEKIREYLKIQSDILGNIFRTADFVRFVLSLDGVNRAYLKTPLEDITLDPWEYFDFTLDVDFKLGEGLDKFGDS